MNYPQYGIYLIPPPPVLYPLAIGHLLMSGEFKAHTGGRFMVHCTVKGFFKLAEGVTPQDFIPALDKLMAESKAFTTQPLQLLYHPNEGWANGFALLLERNEPFLQLNRAVWEVVAPYIAPDCLFSARDGRGDTFYPHLTLAMSDIPRDPGLTQQALALAEYAVSLVPKGNFVASDMQLIEFYSEDWAGNWFETLDFKQLKGWKLAE